MSDIQIDCIGLKCPLPVLLARKRIGELKPGSAMTILADDPLAPLDLAHMAQEEGLELINSAPTQSYFEVVLRRPA